MCLYGWKLLMVNHNLAMFGAHWSTETGDIKYLIFHLTLQDHTSLKDHMMLNQPPIFGSH